MKYTDLVAQVSERTGVQKQTVARVLKASHALVNERLGADADDKLQVPWLGRFVRKRKPDGATRILFRAARKKPQGAPRAAPPVPGDDRP